MGAMALTWSACDKIEESDALPQTNPQLEMIDAGCVAVEPVTPTGGGSIDLGGPSAAVTVARVVENEGWPEGYTANVPFIEVSTTDDFAAVRQLEATMDGDMVNVDADAWEVAQLALVGKNPATVTYYVRCAVQATGAGQTVRLGGVNHFYGDFPVQVKPIDQFGGQVIEQEYYLLTSDNNYDFSKAIKCSNSGKDAYDDPSFSGVINAPAGGVKYVLIPGTTYYQGSFGLNYGVDASGALVASESGMTTTPGEIAEMGPYMVTVNLVDLTAASKLAIKELATPGDSNGWSHAASQKIGTTNYVDYTGYASLNSQFKFSSGSNWDDGINYGYAGTEGKLTTDGSAGNLPVATPGLYFCKVNPLELTYSLTEISTIGVIGDATPKGWDGDTALEPSADKLIWQAVVTLGDGSFKFRANGDWDINLGGDTDNLTQDGANIPSPGAGTYQITLDLSSLPYTCTFTAQ